MFFKVKWPSLAFYPSKCDIVHYGSFTLAKFVSETVSDSDMKQTCLGHLGWCDTDRIISIGQGK